MGMGLIPAIFIDIHFNYEDLKREIKGPLIYNCMTTSTFLKFLYITITHSLRMPES